ncbi:MAG: hypothetical protein FWD17_03885 [Polyangiaceae bacterium]|nr:hypothetical protein [Polyangiaceae bacterium]
MADIEKTRRDETAPAVAGVLQVTPLLSGKSAVRIGPAAGWLNPRGIQHWEREVLFVARADVTPELARGLRATLPVEQIAPKRYPLAHRAAEASPLVVIAPNLAGDARARGVRVHSVGIDRVSSGFFYLAEGGEGDSVHAHANLIEMLLPSVGASPTNAEIAAVLEDVVDRLLVTLSGGVITELTVELADALPRLARDGTGLAEVDLDAFEAQARSLAEGSLDWSDAVRRLAAVLGEAEGRGREVETVPLYGDARRERLPPLDVIVSGRTLRLPALHRWTVRGTPRLGAGETAGRARGSNLAAAPDNVAGPATSAPVSAPAEQKAEPAIAVPSSASTSVAAAVAQGSEEAARETLPWAEPAATLSPAAAVAVQPPLASVEPAPAAAAEPMPAAAAEPALPTPAPAVEPAMAAVAEGVTGTLDGAPDAGASEAPPAEAVAPSADSVAEPATLPAVAPAPEPERAEGTSASDENREDAAAKAAIIRQARRQSSWAAAIVVALLAAITAAWLGLHPGH